MGALAGMQSHRNAERRMLNVEFNRQDERLNGEVKGQVPAQRRPKAIAPKPRAIPKAELAKCLEELVGAYRPDQQG